MDTTLAAPDVALTRPLTTAGGGLLKDRQQESNADAQSPELLKEEKLLAELSRQKAGDPAEAVKSTSATMKASEIRTSAESSPATRRNSESRAPNWSQLSAQVNGYTQLQRAMTLYQQIDRL
ncbi:MAG: hypothetical protein JJU10_08745 [Idiomarina sp.]|nr:hypothetical protein [Idiomarina sp.]